MSYKSKIEVIQSVIELRELLIKTKNYKLKQRIKGLIYFKENPDNTQEQISNMLGIGYSTYRMWLKDYNTYGIDYYLTIKPKGKPKSIISVQLHKALEQKVKDSKNPFKGYWEVVNWIEVNFNQKVNYQTIRKYLIKNFGTKLKTPRKSHYKKDEQAIEAFKKKINERVKSLYLLSLGKDKIDSVNLYFQDEARFGLMTHLGKCLTAKGVKPLVSYQQAFKSTYLYGSFSPINGDSFVFEIEGTSSYIFYQYLKQFSEYKPYEFKIILIDNAGFHSLKHFEIPKNIALIRIPPYSPELNPAEKIWAYIKQRYKNNTFINLQRVKYWLHDFINKELHSELVKSITNDKLYLNAFNDCNI